MNFSDDLKYHLVKLLAAESGLTQRALARELGISLGKTHYCLQQLIDAGWIEIVHDSDSRHKQNLAHQLTPTGQAARVRLAERNLNRKQAEYAALREEIEVLRRDMVDFK